MPSRRLAPMMALSLALPLGAGGRAEAQAAPHTSSGEARAGEAGARPIEDEAAQDDFGARAVVERPLAAGSDLDPTAAATVVDARDRPRALETTDELMLEVPGTQARRLGGVGSFTTLSLRGAAPEHTAVLFGDVPLDPVQGGAFDLSTVPVALLSGVEVYRGGAPLWLGSGAIGGVLRLLPRRADADRSSVTLGVGSFGTRSVDADATVERPEEGLELATAVGATHTDGDFPFVHPGTSLDPGDDRSLRRRNNRLDEGKGLLWLGVPAGGGRLEALVLGYGRVGGEPGPAIRPALLTRRSLARAVAALAWDIAAEPRRALGDRPPLRLRLALSLGHERSRFTDRLRETGLERRATDDRSTRLTARAAGEWQALRGIGFTALLSYAREGYAPRNGLSANAPGASSRDTGAAGVELRLTPRIGGLRTELRASLRLEVSHARIVDTRAAAPGDTRQVTDLLPTGRVAAVLEPTPGITLGGSAALGSRTPSFTELFGDRGFLIGNARLRREKSLSTDASAVFRGRAGPLNGAAEARLFALFADGLIRYRANNQGQALPENVAAARVLGAELGARGHLGAHLSLSGAATFMAPEDVSAGARDLPLRPRFQTYVRPELTLRALGPFDELTFFVDLTHVSSSFTDVTNVVAFEARTHVGAGLAAATWGERLLVALTARDLGDARGEDVLGYPLPGRSFALTLTLQTQRAR